MLARDFLQVLTVRFIPPVPIATRKNRKSSSLGRKTRVAAGTPTRQSFFCLFVSSPPIHLAVGRSPFHVTVRRQKNEDVTNNRPRMGSLTSSNSSSGAGATPHDAFQGPAWEKKKTPPRLGAFASELCGAQKMHQAASPLAGGGRSRLPNEARLNIVARTIKFHCQQE